MPLPFHALLPLCAGLPCTRMPWSDDADGLALFDVGAAERQKGDT
jgi:hypothetical protein